LTTRPGPKPGQARGTADGSTLAIQAVTGRRGKSLAHRRVSPTLPAWWPQDTHVVVRVIRHGANHAEVILSTPDRDGERSRT
jgi:hypothetical protein